MQTVIHYATPPGWQERPQLPTLRRLHARPGPQLPRGVRPRPQPAPRSRPAGHGRQDDDRDTFAAFGLPWQGYAAAAIVCLIVSVVLVYRVGQGEPIGPALLLSALGFGVSAQGILDYARAGAAAYRRQSEETGS